MLQDAWKEMYTNEQIEAMTDMEKSCAMVSKYRADPIVKRLV